VASGLLKVVAGVGKVAPLHLVVDQRERAVVVLGGPLPLAQAPQQIRPYRPDPWLRTNAGSVTGASSTGNAAAGPSAIATATARLSARTTLDSRSSSMS
jgi:hypothetical protein